MGRLTASGAPVSSLALQATFLLALWCTGRGTGSLGEAPELALQAKKVDCMVLGFHGVRTDPRAMTDHEGGLPANRREEGTV